MAHDVFISHSTNNRAVANSVCASLESVAIRCWIAPIPTLLPPTNDQQEVLTRGVEPPRVSPYGPEPYASAIPPREPLSGSGC